MSVTTAESLEWVTFSDDGGECCDGRAGVPCPLEAVAAARWKRHCDCGQERTRLCAGHRDTLLADARRYLGMFRCARWECPKIVILLGVEPIR